MRLTCALALGLAFGLGLGLGCAGGDGLTCDDLCHDAGYDDNADELGTMDGGVECVCGGLGVGVPIDACKTYCEAEDFDPARASVAGDSCLCEP